MMKKLLVLALVLSVVGLANASLSVAQTGLGTAEVSGIGYGGGVFAGIYLGFIGTTPDVVFNYNGNQKSVTDITNADLGEGVTGAMGFASLYGMTTLPDVVLWFDMADSNTGAGTVYPNGKLISLIASAPVKVYAVDALEGTPVGQAINLVPEPMTMLLLGLGGLFLRRK